MSVVHSDLAYILKVNTSHYLKEYEIDFTKLVSAMQCLSFFLSHIFSNVWVINWTKNLSISLSVFQQMSDTFMYNIYVNTSYSEFLIQMFY